LSTKGDIFPFRKWIRIHNLVFRGRHAREQKCFEMLKLKN